MPYAAVLFDLDGTLGDTITLYERAVVQALKKWHVHVSHDRFLRWYKTAVHLKEMLAKVGLSDVHAPAVRDHRDNLYERLLRTDVEWLPGAKKTLDRLKGKVPLAIVTGSWLSYVQAIQQKLDVLSYAQALVTADEIHKFMKPHPHGLLLACDRLGVKPEDCLYVGDQQFDVDAATAAGMPCWAIQGKWSPAKITSAERVVQSLEELDGAW